jgi:hypothetical protein
MSGELKTPRWLSYIHAEPGKVTVRTSAKVTVFDQGEFWLTESSKRGQHYSEEEGGDI